jgi:ParB family transcriptional regulator, chromosome partitioning protein
MNAKTVTRAVKGVTLKLDDIEIPSSIRPYNATAVAELSKSIAAIGLQSAPTVIEREGRYVLVAGRHRIEALRLLKHESVLVRVVDFDDLEAKLWAIAENLHRAELTVAERAAQITEYARLSQQKRESEKVVQVAPVSGGRGNEGGDRLVARDLGLSREQIRRAQAIAALPEETKEAARELGYDDNQSALLAAAKASTPEQQVGLLQEIAKRGCVITASARPLRNLEGISGGELARWIKITTPNDRPHVIRVLEQAAAILRDEMDNSFVSGAA